MDDTNSKYELLILKEFEGRLSSQERIELEAWTRNPQNQTFYEEQKKLWEAIGDFQRMKTINKKKALRKVEVQLFGWFSMKALKSLERVAAILFIPLLLASLWVFNKTSSTGYFKEQLVYNTVEIPLGMRSSMILPDGTSVWLNAGSSLKYPVVFEGGNRQVELSGEAFFEVKKDRRQPFIVSTSDMDIKVLGTSFNCSAYPENEKIETALVEGIIEISKKNANKSFRLNPGELAILSKDERTIGKSKANLDKHISWKAGKLVFRDDPMTRVLEKLGRWYNVEFQVEDQEILAYVYSATFSGESLDQVLEMLSLSAPIHYKLLPRKKLEDKGYGKQIIKLKKKR